MKSNKKYCIEIFVNLANVVGYLTDGYFSAALATDRFHIKFDKIPVNYQKPEYYGNDYDLILQDSTRGFLEDTLGWTKIYDTYIAKGDEKYFMFGNFLNTAESKYKLVFVHPENYYNPDDYIQSNYFIEDVSITELPDLIISSPKDVITQGESVQLSANIQDTEVLWYALPDTTQPIGSGTQIWVQPQQSTQYVAITRMCRYTATDSLWIKVKVPQAPPPKPLSIVQNLSHQFFMIQYDERAPLQLYLYNSAGQLVKTQTFNESTEVNIADLAAGVYYCRIMNGDSFVMTERVVKN